MQSHAPKRIINTIIIIAAMIREQWLNKKRRVGISHPYSSHQLRGNNIVLIRREQAIDLEL